MRAVEASLAAAHIAKARAAASDRRGVKRAGAALRVEVDARALAPTSRQMRAEHLAHRADFTRKIKIPRTY